MAPRISDSGPRLSVAVRVQANRGPAIGRGIAARLSARLSAGFRELAARPVGSPGAFAAALSEARANAIEPALRELLCAGGGVIEVRGPLGSEPSRFEVPAAH